MSGRGSMTIRTHFTTPRFRRSVFTRSHKRRCRCSTHRRTSSRRFTRTTTTRPTRPWRPCWRIWMGSEARLFRKTDPSKHSREAGIGVKIVEPGIDVDSGEPFGTVLLDLLEPSECFVPFAEPRIQHREIVGGHVPATGQLM